VNLDSDSRGKSNDVVCLCCFQSYSAHFNYSLPTEVVAVDVCLKSLIINRKHCTHRRLHVASETGF